MMERLRTRWLQYLLRAVLALGLVLVASTACIVIDGLRDELGRADVALVLGSKVEPNGQPSARLQARLDRVVELYRDQRCPAVIVSGGIGREGFDEAVVMRDYLVAQGVPSLRVLLDNQGVNTQASARNAARLAQEHGFKSVLVVSQYFHLPRSRLALQRCGFAEVFTAHAKFFEWRDVYSSLREAIGYAVYWLR